MDVQSHLIEHASELVSIIVRYYDEEHSDCSYARLEELEPRNELGTAMPSIDYQAS
jgi:hypothetical protein